MVGIDAQWWEHLAPKPMHRHRSEIDAHLRDFSRTPYGSEWLRSALTEGGLFRVRPGDAIPNFHMFSMLGRPSGVAPFRKLASGHRTVGRAMHFASGHPLAGDERPMEPTITFELVTDLAFMRQIQSGGFNEPTEGVTEPTQLVTVSAHLLLKPQFSLKRSFVLYQHIFGGGHTYPNDGFFYVGVTKRSWQKRWGEHRQAMQNGSLLTFHKTLREELEAGRVTYINHKVMAVTDDLEQLYEAEEFLVNGHWEDKRRLNMVPGGKSGLKYMRENGMLAPAEVPLPDERDTLVVKWIRDNPRKGQLAPWVSERWKDDKWAVAQICGREGRLSPEQVTAIRELATEFDAATIASRIGALNEGQVKRVLDGRTYTRVT